VPQLGFDRYHAELGAETARFAEVVHDTDPARGGRWRS
jgi:hypothetical protein